MTVESTDEVYEVFEEQVKRAANVRATSMVLRWDQQVMMPEGGTPARAEQSSTLSSLHHEILASEEMAGYLDELDDANLEGDQQVVVRETRRKHERARNVPDELVAELSRTQSEAQEVWERAKAEDDYSIFEPTLETLAELHVERAEHVDPGTEPFEVMYEDGEPYLDLGRVEDLFDELRDGLVPLIEDIRGSDADLATDALQGEFDQETQMALSRDALNLLGFDWERGRIDVSVHPFTSGNQFDARITTRFHDDDLSDALTATIHEFGHATYALGLPDEGYATPLGAPRSHGVHESQSRFWENHVGRSRAFWELFLPSVKDRFPQLDEVTAQEAYEAVNQVYPDNRIRVEADELTYHMHIILRFEIEREIVAGDLDIADVPEAWNDRMESYLGVRPDSDAEGCLQDVHWSSRFASFQNYTIGSVLAAQLAAAAERDLGDLDDLIRDGDFEPLHDWMTEHVHRHGQRYTTDELVAEATGEPLTADYFLDYVEEKYGELYDL
jgi:carboxypeptidase Taq